MKRFWVIQIVNLWLFERNWACLKRDVVWRYRFLLRSRCNLWMQHEIFLSINIVILTQMNAHFIQDPPSYLLQRQIMSRIWFRRVIFFHSFYCWFQNCSRVPTFTEKKTHVVKKDNLYSSCSSTNILNTCLDFRQNIQI